MNTEKGPGSYVRALQSGLDWEVGNGVTFCIKTPSLLEMKPDLFSWKG